MQGSPVNTLLTLDREGSSKRYRSVTAAPQTNHTPHPHSPPVPHPQVGLSKAKDQLTSTEERVKQLTVDLQRVQMDLIAKTSECQGLEKLLAEANADVAALGADKGRVEGRLGEAEELLERVIGERDELKGGCLGGGLGGLG